MELLLIIIKVIFMENQTKLYPSYMGEFYAANPVKFEKRKNNVKPMLYYGLAVVAVIIVIFLVLSL